MQSRAVQRAFEGQFIDVKAARSESDPGAGRVPGDFLSDISLAFDQGMHSGLVYLDTIEEKVVFQDWRHLVDSSSLGGLTLRHRKVLATGIERYEIGFHGTGLKGWILLLHTKGRWFIVGVGNVATPNSSLDNKTLRMLDMLKEEHDRDSWNQLDRESLHGG